VLCFLHGLSLKKKKKKGGREMRPVEKSCDVIEFYAHAQHAAAAVHPMQNTSTLLSPAHSLFIFIRKNATLLLQ
jgi:hypothetical protein